MFLLCAQEFSGQTDQTGISHLRPIVHSKWGNSLYIVLWNLSLSLERWKFRGRNFFILAWFFLMRFWQRQAGCLPSSWDLKGGPLPLSGVLPVAPTQPGLGMGSSLRSLWGRDWQPLLIASVARGAYTSCSCPRGGCVWSRALFSPLGQAWLSMPALTNGFTALVSINEGHDGAQGHVWVILDALQAADGILDALCEENPRSYYAPRAGGSTADPGLTQGLV